MKRRGDPFVQCADFGIEVSSEFTPEPAADGRSAQSWALSINDEGFLFPTGGTDLAKYWIEVVARFGSGESTVARLQVSSDYAQPRARMLASGAAPGARSYRIVARR